VLRKRAGRIILASERLFNFLLPVSGTTENWGAVSQTKSFVAKQLLQFLMSHVREDTPSDRLHYYFTFFQSGTITTSGEPRRSETGHDAVVKWSARQLKGARFGWEKRAPTEDSIGTAEILAGL
jgi:hypothetical protein